MKTSNEMSIKIQVDKEYLTEEQVDAIMNYMEYAEEHFPGKFDWDDTWDVWETPTDIRLESNNSEFDMLEFLESVGVDIENPSIVEVNDDMGD